MKKNNKRFPEGVAALAILLCAAVVFSCGGGGGGDSAAPAPTPPAAVSGKVVLGPVNGAIVFADHLTGPEANYKMDADEAATATTTAADGTFTLPVTPGYAYMAVSFDGTDRLSGRTAPCMKASAGTNIIISPLTTMVAEDSGAAAVIASLGVNHTDDISVKVTPAALLLTQSVQVMADTLINAFDPGRTKLKTDEINDIQVRVMASVASEIKTMTAAQLTNTATLTAMLQTALKKALDAIVADPGHSNITVPNTQTLAQAVCTQSLIDTIATAINPAKTFSTLASDASSEDSMLSSADMGTIEAEKNRASTDAANDCTVVPKQNRPPTISGIPVAQAVVGVAYSFAPTASDPDGNTLKFLIANKPPWASFNAATGALSGTPTAADVGTYSNIVISVTDGVSTASLTAFSITVVTPTGSTGTGGGSGL